MNTTTTSTSLYPHRDSAPHRPGQWPRLLAVGAALTGLTPVAAQSPQPPGSGGPGFFIFIVVMFVMMYFKMIRPQVKKAKQHRAMLDALRKGDEIVTSGGLLGRVHDIGDNFILLDLDQGVRVKLQKTSVQTVLPKGSSKSL